jgi:hypothetical protein
MDEDGGERPPEAQDRPRLVAVPADDAGREVARPHGEPGDQHAARLELERVLSTPGRAGATLGARAMGARAATPAESAASTAPAMAARDEAPEPTTPIEPATPELVSALRAELAMRATAEAGLRARAVDAEARLAARAMASEQTAETLRAVRAELNQLTGLVAGERSRREAAEQRVTELERELEQRRARDQSGEQRERGAQPDDAPTPGSMRDSLEQLRTPAADREHVAVSPGDAGTVQPDRLTDALTRLRANTQPAQSATAPAVPATLAGPFRTLCRRDPALAGRLVISLLGMERVAYPHPTTFDLLLGPGGGSIQVTSSASRTDVIAGTTARPLEQVGFRVVGGPDRIARLLIAGRLRRRLGFGVARVRGDRDGLAALEALLSLPLDLPALVDGGMLSDPTSLLSLVAAMVRPEWTRGAHFAVSHRDGDVAPMYLVFSGGRRPEVTAAPPAGPIATVISCPDHDLASVLTGAVALGAAGVQVCGDVAPLQQLQGWIKRAQSG